MVGIMNNSSNDNTWNINTWNTATTTTGGTNDTFTVSTDSMWYPYYMESTWLPYCEVEYKPQWHIKLGYKNQIKTMWK